MTRIAAPSIAAPSIAALCRICTPTAASAVGYYYPGAVETG